jgi:hypothetical protein
MKRLDFGATHCSTLQSDSVLLPGVAGPDKQEFHSTNPAIVPNVLSNYFWSLLVLVE